MKRPAACLDQPGHAHEHDSSDAVSLATTMELPGLGEEVQITCKGLNIRPPYARMLVDGSKTIEIRKYEMNSNGMSPVMFAIQTKNSPSDITQVIGLLEFGTQKVYHSMEEFRLDVNYHRVQDMEILNGAQGSFNFDKPLYGWHVKTAIPFERPITVTVSQDMPRRSMLGWLRPVSLTTTLGEAESEMLRSVKTRHQI
eukprot:s410_g15.t1